MHNIWTGSAFRKPPIVPLKLGWKALLKLDGAELEKHTASR
jgi:hypothetical protein